MRIDDEDREENDEDATSVFFNDYYYCDYYVYGGDYGDVVEAVRERERERRVIAAVRFTITITTTILSN